MAKAQGNDDPISSKSLKTMNRMADAATLLSTKIGVLDKALKKMGESAEGAAEDALEGFEELRDEVGDMEKEAKDATEALGKLAKTGAAGFSGKDKKQIEKYSGAIGKVRSNVMKLKQAEAKATGKEKKDLQKKIKGNMEVLRGMKSEIQGFGKVQTGLEKGSAAAKGFFQQISAAPDVLGLAGSAAKGLGKALGGALGRFAGPAGAIGTAVKAIWDMGMAADEFVKNANKAFAHVRGPDIMTDDVAKQFKDFNDQIYNAGENIKTGLNAQEIQGFMEALSQAGANVTQLNSGLTSYRDATYVAAKASKTLGMELPQVGSIMGQLMSDYRMDLNDMDKAFVEVAFDAKKSGLSTDRFWNTVQNANASLAMYGVNIGAASKTMTRFTKDAIGGADDASKALQDMYGIFKSGDLGKQSKFLAMAQEGGAKFGDMLFEQIRQREAKAKDIRGEISKLQSGDKTAENIDAMEKLTAQLTQNEVETKQMSKYLAKDKTTGKRTSALASNAVDLSPMIGFLSSSAPELWEKALKGALRGANLADLSQSQLTLLKQISAQFGISDDTMQMIVRGAQTTLQYTQDNLPLLKGVYDTAKKSEKTNQLIYSLGVVQNTTGDAQIKGTEALSRDLIDIGGLQKTSADKLSQMAAADPAAAEKIAAYIKSGSDADYAQMEKLLTSSGYQTGLNIKAYKAQDKTGKELAGSAEDTFKKVVAQTLSFKEMQKIATDEIAWRANSLGYAQKLNGMVAGIYQHFLKKEYVSPAEEALNANKDLTDKFSKKIAEINSRQSTLEDIEKNFTVAPNKTQGADDVVAELQKKMPGLDVVDLSGDLRKAVTEADKKSVVEAYFKKKKMDLQSDITNQEKMMEATGQIQKDGKISSSYLETMVKANPETQKYIADTFEETYAENVKKGGTANAAKKALGDISAKDMAKILVSQKRDITPLTERRPENGNKPLLSEDEHKEVAKTVPATPPPIKATLRSPEIVSSPGAVKLDPGETILPKGYFDIKTMNASLPTGAAGGSGTSGKTFNINVSANEKDLADRIANEIRAVLYKEV